jgi:hypothetical protein
MRQTLQAAGSKCWMDDDDGRVSQSVSQAVTAIHSQTGLFCTTVYEKAFSSVDTLVSLLPATAEFCSLQSTLSSLPPFCF